MQTLRDIAPSLALAAAVLALVLLVLVLVLWARVRRLRRSQSVVLGHHGERDLVAHADSLDSQVRNLRDAVELLTDELDDQKRQLDRALTNRAIVRYDAFRDAGGEQSASFALLDEYRSGVVLSAIAARDFARIYVKHVTEGVADRDLSPEEQQAVAAAVPKPLTPGEAGRRSARAALPDRGPRPADAVLAGEPRADVPAAEAAAGGLPAYAPAEASGQAEPAPADVPAAAGEPGMTPWPDDTEPRLDLEAEATFSPGGETLGDDETAPALEPVQGASAPLQPLLDDDAFTWDERAPARPADGAAPDAGSAAPDAEAGQPPAP